ncbi:hypothetical protein P9112_009717 [Eukaryota sp. TZLM1-RC]
MVTQSEAQYQALPAKGPEKNSIIGTILVGLILVTAIALVSTYAVLVTVVAQDFYLQVQYENDEHRGDIYSVDLENRKSHIKLTHEGGYKQFWFDSKQKLLLRNVNSSENVCDRITNPDDIALMNRLLDLAIPSDITKAEKTIEVKQIDDHFCKIWRGSYKVDGVRTGFLWAVADKLVHELSIQTSDGVDTERIINHQVLSPEDPIFDPNEVCQSIDEDYNHVLSAFTRQRILKVDRFTID